MNSKLALIQRKLERKTPERVPAPETGSLGAAIDAMVQEEIARKVGEAMDRRPPPRVRDLFRAPEPYTSFDQIPPVPRAPAPKAVEIQFGRDELGRYNRVSMGDRQYYVQRNELGEIVRLVPADIAPMPPALPAPALAGRG
jgi:hypothetical protein